MKNVFRIALIGLFCLAAPFLVAVFYSAIEAFMITRDCSHVVDNQMAIEVIEEDLRRPSMSVIMKGLKPKVVEIYEIGYHHFDENEKRQDGRAYEFRLEGVRGERLPIAYVDSCRRLELAGSLRGD